MNLPHLTIEAAIMIGGYVLAAAVIDWRSKRIPNYLTVPAAILGLAYAFLPGWIGPVGSISGFALGFGILLLPWILGGGGMGDVKLLAALGAWLGPVYFLGVFVGAIFFAAFGALAILVSSAMTHGISTAKHRYLATAGGNGTTEGPRRVKRVLPFGVPVAASTIGFLALKLLQQYA